MHTIRPSRRISVGSSGTGIDGLQAQNAGTSRAQSRTEMILFKTGSSFKQNVLIASRNACASHTMFCERERCQKQFLCSEKDCPKSDQEGISRKGVARYNTLMRRRVSPNAFRDALHQQPPEGKGLPPSGAEAPAFPAAACQVRRHTRGRSYAAARRPARSRRG